MPAKSDNEAGTDPGHRSRQGLGAVGGRGAQGEQMVFFRAHLFGQIVDVAHGIAADAFAHNPGGIIHVLRPRKLDGLGEFLDPLID